MTEIGPAVRFGILTVSDTRTVKTDRSGQRLAELVRGDGHRIVARDIVRDERREIQSKVKQWLKRPDIDVILATGGTGLTGRDVTPEALEPIFEKAIPGFGELFRMLSYQKIGASTIQSRATAGIAEKTYIFAIPGSTTACEDAWEMVLRSQFDPTTKPCSFIALKARLGENSPKKPTRPHQAESAGNSRADRRLRAQQHRKSTEALRNQVNL